MKNHKNNDNLCSITALHDLKIDMKESLLLIFITDSKIISMRENFKQSELTNKVLRCFYTVYNKLGYGFLEKVYENALLLELRKNGLNAVRQVTLKVYYDSVEIGYYFADIIVDDAIIVEIKAAEGLVEMHEAQLTNYLKATSIEVGLLLNFGKNTSM